MINIAVVFGGLSCEHDISIITAMQVINNLDKSKYKVFPIYIDKQGRWLYNKDFVNIESVLERSCDAKECFFVPSSDVLYKRNSLGMMRTITKTDVVLVAMHGANGEDGVIKVVCQLSNIKCVCPDFLPSALALDKSMFKLYIKGLEKINVVPSVIYDAKNNLESLKKNLKDKKINYPIILKPATLGSSIGISVCHNEEELEQKLSYSLRFDDRILIEQKLSNFKEYNIAVVRTREGVIVSDIEQPVNKEEILSYSDKYLSGSKVRSQGMSEAKRIFPAKVKAKIKKELINVATYVYESMSLSSVVRFDFLYDCDTDILYLNELNTIPGSYAYYLFNNLTFSQLLDKCIDYVYFESQEKRDKIRYFPSTVLKNVNKGIKK